VRTKLSCGFATLSEEDRAAMGSKGGQRSQAANKSPHFNEKTAVEWGRKGGKETAKNKGNLIRAGRKGGIASGKARRAKRLLSKETT
jgi:general stress protein YciG